jgi:multidrug resistance efflux pump
MLAARAEDQLPSDPAPDSFEVEPALLIPNAQVDGVGHEDREADPAAPLDVAQLERKLDHARKTAADAQHLFKSGVLAKVEVEERALRVVRVESDLAKARVEQAKEFAAQQHERLAKGDIDAAEAAAADRALTEATVAAQRAMENRQRAELEFATANLKRQQKLVALGIGRKADLHRAEENVAALQQQAE